jgi:hypothetical protein
LLVPLSRASAGELLRAPTPVPVVDSATAAAVQRAARQSGLRPLVLRAALAGYRRAVDAGAVKHALPSHTRRLWVLDLARGKVVTREFVAHGRGSGDDLATRFSNRDHSYASSIGTFVTANTYDGKNGLSLRLEGLDAGLNDHALERGIVVHGAWYVSQDMIRKFGRLGRSEGCPALSETAAPRIIDLIEGGSVLFGYYPTPALQRSLGTL